MSARNARSPAAWIGAIALVALVFVVLAFAAPASRSATNAAVRPLIFSTSFATYSIRPDGTDWRQLNECTLNPLTTDGRHLVGTFPGFTSPGNMLALPAGKEVVGDCDSAGDQVRRKYELRREGGFWLSLDWSADARSVVGVQSVGSGFAAHGQVATFNPNGTGYRLVTPRGLDTRVRENAFSAVWAPTGKQIVFSRQFSTEDCPEYEQTGAIGLCERNELVRMNADGSGAVSLYRPPQVDSSSVDDLPPGSPFRKLATNIFFPFAWHGSKIYMKTNDQVKRDASYRLASINEDGSGFKFLTAYVNDDPGQPALSPDGRQIAIAWDLSGAGKNLYLMGSDGGRLRKLRIPLRVKSKHCGAGRIACINGPNGAGPLASVTW